MIRSQHKGFTLIELLVVIAIIGILSAVVLASLNTARSKGSDAAIQSDLSSLQTQAEIYYNTTGNNSYGPNADGTGSCTLANTMFDTNSGHASYDAYIVRAISAADSANGSGAVGCGINNGRTAYVVVSALVNGITIGGTTYGFWCVDSSGNARPETTVYNTNNCNSGTCTCP
jgi:prepilin-type N-terminal cleavage/methylation domain-containing protein